MALRDCGKGEPMRLSRRNARGWQRGDQGVRQHRHQALAKAYRCRSCPPVGPHRMEDRCQRPRRTFQRGPAQRFGRALHRATAPTKRNRKWPCSSPWTLRGGAVQTLGLSLGDKLKAEVMRRRSDARWLLARGGVAWNETLRQADGGILVSANLPVLDVDAWLKAIDSGDAPASADAEGDGSQWPLSALTLQADALQVLGESRQGGAQGKRRTRVAGRAR